jgi:hypothetical protein
VYTMPWGQDSRLNIGTRIRAPLIAYQLRKYFLFQPSPERIFL